VEAVQLWDRIHFEVGGSPTSLNDFTVKSPSNHPIREEYDEIRKVKDRQNDQPIVLSGVQLA
jgi:hypothetical protein